MRSPMRDVVVAADLSEALDALADDPATEVLAGGTDLMVEVNRGRRLERVVCVSRVPELRRWEVDGKRVRIGAAVTYTEMLDGGLAEAVPALAQAARTVGSPPIRNAGTLGGNLATASPAGDTLPVLAALDARIHIAGPHGERETSLESLMTGAKRTSLEPGELILRVELPRASGGQEFRKIGPRNAMAISMASVAVVADALQRRVACALGAVAAGIPRAHDAEEWVAAELDWEGGQPVSDEVAGEFGRRAAAAASPIDDHRASAAYRRRAVAVLAGRALQGVFAT